MFKLLLLLDDDYGNEILQSYFEGLCEQLCKRLEISQHIAASNARDLMARYENEFSDLQPEDLLIVTDVLDTNRNLQLDEEIIREACRKDWGGRITILFFSGEKPTYLPEKTYWVKKTGDVDKDVSCLIKATEGRIPEGRIGTQSWDEIKNKVEIPWCYEYFLELSLRLLSLTKENKEKIKNIIVKRKTEWKLKKKKFDDLEKEVQTFIENNDDVNILHKDYSKKDYKVIYNELKWLSYPERKKFLGEV